MFIRQEFALVQPRSCPLNSSGVITILPERPVSILALVVLLRGAPGDELHTLRDSLSASVFHEPLLSFEHAVEIPVSVPRRLYIR